MVNILKSAEYVFATPAWADDKNENDSYVFLNIVIHDKNGRQFKGHGEYKDHWSIPQGHWATLPVGFDPAELSQIIYEDIVLVQSFISYIKEDFQKNFREDQWTFRWEMVLIFENNLFLSGGASNPESIEFVDRLRSVQPAPKNYDASNLRNYREVWPNQGNVQ